MKSSNAEVLARYRAEDYRKSLMTSALLGLFLTLVFVIGNSPAPWSSANAWACLGSAIVCGIAYYQFPQRQKLLNIGLGLMYAALLLWEWQVVGFPTASLAPTAPGQYLGKGILLDILVSLAPGLYIGIRCLLILPLLGLWQPKWYV